MTTQRRLPAIVVFCYEPKYALLYSTVAHSRAILMADRLANAVARRVFLWLHGLCDDWPRAFSRADLPKLVERIGFVQIDAIRTVELSLIHI